MSISQVFTNARLVLPDGVVPGSLHAVAGLIAAIDSPTHLAAAHDCEGDWLMPGFVEMHTDNFERHLMPRPKVQWAELPALVAHDAEVTAAGITTVEVVGVDPGITDVFVTASTTSASKSMSSKEYYHLSKVNYSKPLICGWNEDGASVTEGQVPESFGRTADLAAFGEYATWYLASLAKLLAHRRERGYRKLRFLRYGHKLRSISEMCDRIAPRGKTVIVGFGDWKGPKDSPISRKTVGPLLELKKALAQRPNVILLLVDEYNTSKTDSATHLPLSNMKGVTTCRSRDGKRYTTSGKIHKVLHCRNSEGSLPNGCDQTTWNRDKNAARNILNLLLAELQGLPRPEAFRRNNKPCKQTVAGS